MESHRPSWSWKEGVRFALSWNFRTKEEFPNPLPINKMERVGSWIINPLYKILDYVSRRLRRPFTVIFFTCFIGLILGVVFYNIPAFIFLGKIVPTKLLRFSLFIYIELVLLGMGCKAFGRFHNPSLVTSWKKGKLIPVFPGEPLAKN